jgi:acetolactate synthase-1/3 small subunit
MFRAKIVDVAPEALTIEATGSPDKVAAMLELLDPYGIRELVRTGRVALARGAKGIADKPLRVARPA